MSRKTSSSFGVGEGRRRLQIEKMKLAVRKKGDLQEGMGRLCAVWGLGARRVTLHLWGRGCTASVKKKGGTGVRKKLANQCQDRPRR